MTKPAVTLTLPLPPSINSYWRSVSLRSGVTKVLISKEGRQWKKKALQIAAMQRPARLEGDVDVTMRVYFKDRRRDLDNVAKPALDLLQAAGIVENDRQVARLELVRGFDKGNPRIEIAVEEIAIAIPRAA